jgi:protocatechuate 3,4-dioxygenase beta subunit
MVPAEQLEIVQDNMKETIEGHDDFTDDEYSDDDIVSLLEENARLRKLVVRLSEIVLRNVADVK